MENQAYLFFVFILNGFIIGLLFDVFRIIRKCFKTNDFITLFQDILFWILSGSILLYSIFKFNNGELRGFIFIALLIGAVCYLLLFSKLFITVNVIFINILKKIIYYILILPLKVLKKFLKKVLLKPITFLFINFRKILSKLNIKKIKYVKKNKNNEYKKDLI